MRSIAVASGKGGVGKTSISLNLGLALADKGLKVCVVDADVAMANLGILLGVDRPPISLHNVLTGEASMKDAVYDGPIGLNYVPAGLGTERLRRMDYGRLRSAVNELKGFDFVIIDCPSGLAADAQAGIKAAKELLVVVTPEPSSLADALKVRSFAEKNGVRIAGFVYNMYYADAAEVSSKDMATVLEAKLLAQAPIDANVRRASATQEPVFLKYPGTVFSQRMRVLAGELTGEPVDESNLKKDWLAELIEQITRLFRV